MLTTSPTPRDFIEATGHLLATYHADLTFILNFQDFRKSHKNKVGRIGYFKNESGTFQRFLNDFRVARNVVKGNTNKLLRLTLKQESNDVDEFANKLKKAGITHGKTMKSLASKLLFLKNPSEVIPMDTLTRKALGVNENNYAQYIELVNAFQNQHSKPIHKYLNAVHTYLTKLESTFKDDINNIDTIRYNRYIDKLLWTIGGNITNYANTQIHFPA